MQRTLRAILSPYLPLATGPQLAIILLVFADLLEALGYMCHAIMSPLAQMQPQMEAVFHMA